MPKLFTAAQLAGHTSKLARWWHLSRVKFPWGWREIQPTATFTGVVLKGSGDPDGDTNFELYVLPFLTLHCEVDPVDLDRFRAELADLDLGARVSVSGRFVLDTGHNVLELHPVTQIVRAVPV